MFGRINFDVVVERAIEEFCFFFRRRDFAEDLAREKERQRNGKDRNYSSSR